ADVTYGTNNEFGFDYLRDNMKYDVADFVQRDLHYAIVDEVDSILIDESRTPLIISGPAEASTGLYYAIDQIIPYLKKEKDFTIDEKAKSVMLTDEGVAEVEKRLKVNNLYDPKNISIVHHVNQALRAHAMYKRDVDYVVNDGKVMIVDEFTGRLMPGRRWSDGLHQAVEAKEKVKIENENQTLASVTFQNFFRMYSKLAGMTGTAETEAAEFAKIYNLDVMVMPPNLPMTRKDFADVIYKTEEAKFKAVVSEIEEHHKKDQPVLVGTISIEKSERIGEMLKRRGVKHHVLNAKYHEQEAVIVAQAGRKGSVTIATNMAGRGTDIMLGGNPEFLAKEKLGVDAKDEEIQKLTAELKPEVEKEKQAVIAAGGLHIIGTERHESRRIDNQLRGRSGRQGDPGSSRFFLSLEDDLLRIFGGDRMKSLMERFGMGEDEVIEHPWLTRAIANAQSKVEGHNFSIRKNLLEYDDVMNQQRHTIYGRRKEILKASDNKDLVCDFIDEIVTKQVEEFVPKKLDPDFFDSKSLVEKSKEVFGLEPPLNAVRKQEWSQETIGKKMYEEFVKVYEEKRGSYPEDVFQRVERFLLLSTLDTLWKDHLLQMDHLREGIGLRGYGQKDPLLEYKKEGFSFFQMMMERFSEEALEKLFHVQIRSEEVPAVRHPREEQVANLPFAATPMKLSHGQQPILDSSSNPQASVGRNDPCPCGSGKKFKKCHGA
ncbi:MAG: preprotein translocase subunit SecA, partial [Deltaproteobacteria bacterium]|nr:preprotein translocase subunit SecA [Deltaproteobacteria bacterium]